MDAVAERAGIAKGSLYNYFKSKHDLFEQVFAAALAEDEADNEELVRTDLPAMEKLDRLLDNWFARLEHYRHVGLLALEYWTTAVRERRQGSDAMSFAECYARWRGRLATVLTQGVESGEFGGHVDPMVGATLIEAMLDGLTVHLIFEVGLDANEDLLARMKNAIHHALTAGLEERGDAE